MNRKFYLGALLLSAMGSAQVGINTENPQVTLHIEANTKEDKSKAGILIPRLEQNPERGNANGQLIYNTTENQFYYWDGTTWQPIASQVTNTHNYTILNSKFIDTRSSTELTINNYSSETPITGAKLDFTLDEKKPVQFYSTVNFAGVSSAFAPLFKLKLTNTSTNAVEIIDQASNTFLSDGVSTYYGNLGLMTIKELPAGSYKVEVIAYYNNCCEYDFTYKIGGKNTPASILIQYP